MTATREEIDELMLERCRKLSPEDVQYEQAPEGSAFRCSSCSHGYSRHSDGFPICELIRSEEIDIDGIRPDFRCNWWSVDNDIYPLTEETPIEGSPAASGDEAQGDR